MLDVQGWFLHVGRHGANPDNMHCVPAWLHVHRPQHADHMWGRVLLARWSRLLPQSVIVTLVGSSFFAQIPPKSKKKKGSKKAKNSPKPENVTEIEPQEQSEVTSSEPAVDGVSPLALYGPLYPSFLLLGLRLLDRSFAKPSPLALSILPRIKSLG